MVAAARQRLVILADQGPQHGELPGSGPRLHGLPLAQQPEHLITRRPRAAPTGPAGGLKGHSQRPRRQAGIPLPAPAETGKPRVTARRAGTRTDTIAARQARATAGRRALTVPATRLLRHAQHPV